MPGPTPTGLTHPHNSHTTYHIPPTCARPVLSLPLSALPQLLSPSPLQLRRHPSPVRPPPCFSVEGGWREEKGGGLGGSSSRRLLFVKRNFVDFVTNFLSNLTRGYASFNLDQDVQPTACDWPAMSLLIKLFYKNYLQNLLFNLESFPHRPTPRVPPPNPTAHPPAGNSSNRLCIFRSQNIRAAAN